MISQNLCPVFRHNEDLHGLAWKGGRVEKGRVENLDQQSSLFSKRWVHSSRKVSNIGDSVSFSSLCNLPTWNSEHHIACWALFLCLDLLLLAGIPGLPCLSIQVVASVSKYSWTSGVLVSSFVSPCLFTCCYFYSAKWTLSPLSSLASSKSQLEHPSVIHSFDKC